MSAHASIERVIAMSERLTAALEADIAALERGQTRDMRTLMPDVQLLSATFIREAQTISAAIAKNAPPDIRARLATVTTRFRETLALHARVLTRMRNATEGMIRAVSEEVERQMAPGRTYAPATIAAKPAAMLYNSVI